MCQQRTHYDRNGRAKSLRLILMDMLMPEMDGIDATRILRQMPALDSVPILALTASAFDQDRERLPGGRHGRLCQQTP